MKSIESLLSDIREAASDILGDGGEFPGSVNLMQVGAAVLGGERRRADTADRLGVPVPRLCIFSVTWECNLDCAGCYAANYARGNELSIDEIRDVLSDLRRLGSYIFVIAGGEPLLVDGLIDVLAAANDGLFLLFTNGTLVDAAAAESIGRGGNILPVVSVDGCGEQTDSRRGEGVWARAMAAMAALKNARTPFAFASMATHKNLRDVTSRQWFDQMWDAGARFAFLIDYIPFAHNVQPDLVLTDDDLALKKDLVAQRYAEARPMVLNFPPAEYAVGPCHAAGRGMIHINADGYVEPCPYSHFAADNVRDKSFEDILRSPFLSTIRADLLDLPNPRGQCLLFDHQREVQQIARQTGGFDTEDLTADG